MSVMKSMRLERAAAGTLQAVDEPIPTPGPGEVLLRVRACGVCRTDLHVVDGELPVSDLPLSPGHQIVGVIEAHGPAVGSTNESPPLRVGQRVGVPWLAWTCGVCQFCTTGRENLCLRARFTGWTRPGGYRPWTTADARYVFPLPDGVDDSACAPWLCAGLIGHRAYRMAGPGRRLGIYGFGAAGHIVAQVAKFEGREVHAFTRPGDQAAQRLAHDLGASWVGGSDEQPPHPLDAAIIFASDGALVPRALAQVDRGATVVCAGIHMSDIPAFSYDLLWGERVVRSVANLTRADAREFLALAPRVPVHTQVTRYPLNEANAALSDLRSGRLTGAAVLIP
jgi:propanol-preferring alcohol dehydrogenase